MIEESKKCFRCANFDRFFIRGEKSFKKIDFGHCCKKGQTVESNGNCEDFKAKSALKSMRRRVECSLYDLLMQITTVRELLEAEMSENEEL